MLSVEKVNRTTAPEYNQELFDKVFGPEAVSSQEEFDAKVRETIQRELRTRERGCREQQHRGAAGGENRH